MPRNQGTSRKGKPKKEARAAGMGRALQKSHRAGGGMSKNRLGGMSVGGGLASPSTAMGATGDQYVEKNKSLLEMDHLEDFLVQAEMSNREFASAKERFVVLDTHGVKYDPNQQRVKWQDQAPAKAPQFSFEELSVPRRPKWDSDTTPEQLDQLENEAFLQWRRAIAAREEELFSKAPDNTHAYNTKTVTPYEKNLQVWRQLWRVLERCSCVVQLVDGRNPLFYLSEDLRKYAEEELGKPMMVVVNKSDYLSREQRLLWSKYFDELGIEHVFFSAHKEQAKLDKAAQLEAERLDQLEQQRQVINEDSDVEDDGDTNEGIRSEENLNTSEAGQPVPTETDSTTDGEVRKNGVDNLLTREELTKWMNEFAIKHNCKPNPRYENRLEFGTVGFPNVGKSSVINVLMGNSKHTHGLTRVGVAAQPGKTKHFQTLLLPGRDDMMLCDCPGLVFPSFVSNTADLIAAGVYPIAQMRDHWPVIELICRRIPREIINASYGIKIPKPTSQDLQERGLRSVPPPTAEEFLSTYCIARNMVAASSGVPDYTRASRIVIKDYVSGKLLYCHPPPTLIDENIGRFHRETVETALTNQRKLREKLSQQPAVEKDSNQSPNKDEDDEVSTADEKDILDPVDQDLLEFIGGPAGKGDAPQQGGKRGKAHKTRKKHGRKGRKLRDSDPYGCHADPDEMLQKSATAGVVVNAGKHSRKGYTRPTDFGKARSALETKAQS